MADDLFKNRYRISSIRLPGWDYSRNGYYFVTICVRNQECIFGYVKNEKMILSEIGKIAEQCWLEIPNHFPFVKPDVFLVMPNHVHGIIVIKKKDSIVETQDFASLHQPNTRSNRFGPQSKNLGSIVRGFKIGVRKQAALAQFEFEWQPRFYDRIIQTQKELWNVRKYIHDNPNHWDIDEENPGVNP